MDRSLALPYWAIQLAEHRHMLSSSKRFDRIRGVAELTANLTIVIAVAVGATVWMRRPHSVNALDPMSATGAVSPFPVLGTQIALPGVDWRPQRAMLIVAISSACHYRISSTPFYSEMTQSARAAPIVVVMPQEEKDAIAFLREHAVTPRSVVSSTLASIQVSATPTLLLFSSSGTVTKEWSG